MMTLIEIRAYVAKETQQKVCQIRARKLALPDKIAARCELCDQLSQEIYDYAVCSVIRLVDRHHLPYNVEALLNTLHEDFVSLSASAVELVSSSPNKHPTEKHSLSGKKSLPFLTGGLGKKRGFPGLNNVEYNLFHWPGLVFRYIKMIWLCLTDRLKFAAQN
jgi:hypothetical protein|nr:hypothetical protein [uncultured Dyadobacter sp.]